MTAHIRPARASDVPALQEATRDTGLFPPEMLPDMIASFLEGGSDELWLTACLEGAPLGFCMARPEPMTDGTWNMLAIAIRPEMQSTGLGTSLTYALEEAALERGARLLIVDTSGAPEFSATRAFYGARGYNQVARIEGFWSEEDAKVTFAKTLA